MVITPGKLLVLIACIIFSVAFALLALANPGPKVWPELIALGLAFFAGSFIAP